MGVSRTGAEFAGKIGRASGYLNGDRRPTVMAGARAAQLVFQRTPGVPRRVAGRKVGVTARVVGENASVRFTGPAHLVNNPTKAHDIAPRRFAGTRGRGRRAQKGAAVLRAFGVDASSNRGALKLRDGSLRDAVHHPGTHGKQFFQHGKPGAAQAAVTAMHKDAVKSLAKAFK